MNKSQVKASNMERLEVNKGYPHPNLKTSTNNGTVKKDMFSCE